MQKNSHWRELSDAEEGNGSNEWLKVRTQELDSLVPPAPFATCVTLGKLLNLSAPWLLYLQNRSSNNVHLKALEALNVMMQVAGSKLSPIGSCYYFFL